MQSSISKTVILSSRRWFIYFFLSSLPTWYVAMRFLFVVMIHVLCASISMRLLFFCKLVLNVRTPQPVHNERICIEIINDWLLLFDYLNQFLLVQSLVWPCLPVVFVCPREFITPPTQHLLGGAVQVTVRQSFYEIKTSALHVVWSNLNFKLKKTVKY